LPKSEAAIERAGILTDALGADLTLLHVVPPDHSERVLEQNLQIALAQMKSRAQSPLWHASRMPRVAVRAGNPARQILDAIEQTKARLLILGPHRKRPLRDALEGTIAEKVLAARKCPVLIVRDEPVAPYRRVLLALDVSDASTSAISAAESLVISPKVHARIVHAYTPPYEGILRDDGVDADTITNYATAWKHETERAVRDFLKYQCADCSRYDIQVEHGRPASAVLRAIEQYEPDLLVMGTRGRGRLHQALVGSVANSVLHGATCDALIVPEGSFGASKRRSQPAKGASRAPERARPEHLA
jgi:nucleotide-binding universal stress UspA family protein